MQTSFTAMISFIFSSWLIDEFDNTDWLTETYLIKQVKIAKLLK